MKTNAQTKVLPSHGGLMNRQWNYTPADKSDIRVTFTKVRDALVTTKQMVRLKGLPQ